MPANQLSTAFLNKIRTYPHLPTQTWYYITIVTLSVCNRPELFGSVLHHAFAHNAIPSSLDSEYVKEERQWLARNPGKIGKVDDEGRESALRILRKCREGLLKSGFIGGFPKAINGLYHLRKLHQPHLLDVLPGQSSGSDLHPLSSVYPTSRIKSLPPGALDIRDNNDQPEGAPSPSQALNRNDNGNPTVPFINRGATFFNSTYGTRVAPKVLKNLQLSSPDLHVAATWIYSLILSEDTVLVPKETSYTLIASLLPQDVNAQLKPHLQGALNNGAEKEEVESIREMVIEICKEVGISWKGEIAKL